MSDKKVVAFVCQFSNGIVRSQLKLSTLSFENKFRSFFGHNQKEYVDRVVWVTEYIKGFEKDPSHEYHIISTHLGMKRTTQSFILNGIHYHFINEEPFFLIHYFCEILKVYRKNFYKRNRRFINSFIDKCKPDLVAVCGTENIYYSSSVVNVSREIPVFGILQSLRNNPKLMSYEHDEWMINAERKVLQRCDYFGGGGAEYYNVVKGFVKNPVYLKLRFPQGIPPIYDLAKENDFIFYAARIGKNKGIEDVLRAFAKVVQKFPSVRLAVAGRCSEAYEAFLNEEYIKPYKLGKNVRFCGFFPKFDDVYKEVQKSKYVIVPGISASLNGTVRESMQMGMPVIVYETTSSVTINKDETRLLTAKMLDTDDLAVKMIYAIEHPEEMNMMAARAKKYADVAYNPDAICKQLISDFKVVMDHYYDQTPIPESNLIDILRKQ